MAYLHDRYPFHAEQGPQMMYYPPPPYTHYPKPHQPQHQGPFYPAYAQPEFTDFTPNGAMLEDYEDGGEVSTRPRLTKEQVEVLESQFQAHPKPNGIVKRQLASQTKLSMPRVSNWFQNRRAKAKQQRKQEEFESTQSMGMSHGWTSEEDLNCHHLSPAAPFSAFSHGRSASHGVTDRLARPPSNPEIKTEDPSKAASWASLQRAITAAQASRGKREQDQDIHVSSMLPPEIPRQPSTQPSVTEMTHNTSDGSFDPLTDWSSATDSINEWAQPHVPESIPFDFGFDPPSNNPTTIAEIHLANGPANLMSTHGYTVPTDSWLERPLETPTFPLHQVSDFASVDNSPITPYPKYNLSRRGSSSDDLTANFGNFALAGTPPTRQPMPTLPEVSNTKRFEGEIDLAARRKRPRPAAIGTAAMRSRSYGALSSMSPTFRTASTTPNPHSIRHVKSTGHSLNARFAAGIRKTSSAQRSPLNISSFAEAEAFNQLMAQQSVLAQTSPNAPVPGTLTPFLSPETIGTSQLPYHPGNDMAGFDLDLHKQYPIHDMPDACLSMTSPPVTPFKQDFMYQNQGQMVMPLMPAGSQYATCPDYTPPYSAGPHTSSSWSDAPLTSPDYPSFPPLTHIPPLTMSQQQPEPAVPQFQHFMMPPERRSEAIASNNPETRKTEFLMHEFPGQKEEHAHVAQQLAQQKPRNYVFAYTTPDNYEG